MRHELYPSWVKMKYTSAGRAKHAIYPCAIAGSATPGLEPDFQTKDSGAVAATACLSAWVTAIAPLFHTSDTFDSYEVYHKAAIDADPVFVYGAALGLSGTNTAADIAYSEAVYTFKTPLPGGLKLYLMESGITVDHKFALPMPSNPAIDAPSVFVLSADNWILARNGSFPLLPLYMTSKQNDYYRRKYKL